MAEKTGIAWTDSTFNPWMGCAKVGPGCDHCYAERRLDARLHIVQWGAGAPRKRTSAKNWGDPRKWERNAGEFRAQHGRRQRVFCASLADVFDNEAPDAWRADLFNLVDATPNLDWLLLTKRIGNVPKMLAAIARRELPANVWLGATVVNQAEYDRDVRKLLGVPASVRFLSIEPMLGSIAGGSDLGELDWVIVGGESGPSARPVARAWVAAMRDECAARGVPYFFKQWGGVSAAARGCELDGQESKAWPASDRRVTV